MHDDIIEHVSRDDGYNKGFEAGKKFAQDKMLELMSEVVHEYKLQEIRMNAPNHQVAKAQVNAVKFMKNWVINGGHTDLDGDRACLPW